MNAILAVAAGLLAGDAHTVTMPGKYFSPARVEAVVGDAVTWRNMDIVGHDVRAADGSFESGLLARFGGLTVRFDAPGPRPYLCTIHPFMRGEVDVQAALLEAVPGPVLAGEPMRLRGRTAPGAAVRLEHVQADGVVHLRGGAVAAADGTFAMTVAAEAGSYRALTAAGASPPVTPAVLARLDPRIAVHRNSVRVWVRPAQPGLHARLQRYARERFMWRPLDRARLDRRGRARFRVPASTDRVRVVLSRTARGPALAVTDTVRVRDGRHVADPAAPREGGAPGHDDH
jgi:plastocyanin